MQNQAADAVTFVSLPFLSTFHVLPVAVGIDFRDLIEDTVNSEPNRFLAAKESICGLPLVIPCFFMRDTLLRRITILIRLIMSSGPVARSAKLR